LADFARYSTTATVAPVPEIRVMMQGVQEFYLLGGRFSQNAMLAFVQQTLKVGATLGFPLTRMIALRLSSRIGPVQIRLLSTRCA